ncbi:MAG: cysteine dioxygenase [Thermoleophilia bacterium]|nr:cysteine dioxygenase [Thermoleophilia bacterium]
MLDMPEHSLTEVEMQTLLDGLAQAPDLWRDRVEFDDDERKCISIGGNGPVGIWLVCWANGQDTGFHDHDVSRGAAIVVAGLIEEELMAVGTPTAPSTVFGPGDRLGFPAHHIHRMTHVGADRTVTLHAYSPPLRYLGRYEIEGASLTRTATSRDETLRYTGGWDTAPVAQLTPA